MEDKRERLRITARFLESVLWFGGEITNWVITHLRNFELPHSGHVQ